MSFCQTCGTNLPDGSPTCTACGATQGAMPPPPPGPIPGSYPGPTPPGPIPGSYPGPVPQAAPIPAAGLTPNAAGALAYLFGFITGIVFLVLEPFRTDRFVRFHAFQSIFLNLAWIGFWIVWQVVWLTLGAFTHGFLFIILTPINLLIALGGLCLWIYMMYAAYQGKTIQLPIVGALAASQAGITPSATGQRL
jgi:uncharacterized membrane protein